MVERKKIIYCSKCSICNQLNPSRGKVFFISCFQWLFGISVTLSFIVTILVFGALCWLQIGNRRSDSAMVSFTVSIDPTAEETTKHDEIFPGIVFVTTPLNFSDASDYCKKRGWSLVMTVSNEEDELLLFTIRSNKTFSEQCSKSFTGFRRIIAEEWKTSKNEPILFDDDLFVVPRPLSMKNNCVAMIKEYNYSISNVECKFNDPVENTCYICESQKCYNNNSECYKVVVDSFNSVEEASKLCLVEMPESQLASIVNVSRHRDFLKAYLHEDPDSTCSYIYLGMQSNWVYENVLEEKISYVSEQLNSLDASKGYCLIINTQNGKWETADCEEKMCFVCRDGINIE